MEENILRSEINYLISGADLNELKDIYNLLTNYFNGQWSDEDGWDSLPDHQKEKILESIEEGNAGLVTPAKEVIKLAREGNKSNV
jgi:hypothetical protein